MKNNELEKLFKKPEGTFDVLEAPAGHQKRFLEKLESENKTSKKSTKSYWKPLSIAAAIAVLIALGPMFLKYEKQGGLASVSPEMKQTQSFFTSAINEELQLLKNFDNPEAKVLVDDALKQMAVLENDYQKLKKDLQASGNDKRVVHAMIANFQNRISLLEQVVEKLEKIEKLKSQKNETTL